MSENVTEEKLTKKREAYNKWYKKNKSNFNAKRKQRYAKDKGYRVKAIQQAREHRELNPKPLASGELFRVIDGVEVRVYRIGEASEMVGRSIQVLRKWEKEGLVPESTGEGTHRVYTMKQIELLRSLANVINKYRYQRNLLPKQTDIASNHVIDHWEDL